VLPATDSVELPNGLNLPYREQGDASGVPVILLHGFADSWHSFERVLPHLPQSIRAIALTQRGHGDASRPAEGYRSRDFTGDLAAFMDALDLEAAVIAGASSGGFVALRFTIEHRQRTLGLVLIGSPITLRDKPRVLEVWEATISRLTDPVDPGFVREFQQSTLAQPVPQPFFEMIVRESLKVPARVWSATLAGLLEDDWSGELHNISVPTLIAWGDKDAFIRTDQVTFSAGISGSRLIVYQGAGHAFYWEEPDRFAADLAAFVDDLGIRR
jgi:non-heme chloroperoxidase